jgi:hypothetical protein
MAKLAADASALDIHGRERKEGERESERKLCSVLY